MSLRFLLLLMVIGFWSAHAQEIEVKKAILVRPAAEEQDALVGPPTRAEIVARLRADPYNVTALAWGNKIGLLSDEQVEQITKKIFPPELNAAKTQLLPFKKARIDVFMVGSSLHEIESEFSVVSVDDQIRAIGLVSSGDYDHLTPGQRWELYGVDKSRYSRSFGASAMPYALMLSECGSKFYSNTAMHGTKKYGYGHFGSNASHGCIRQYTKRDVAKGDSDNGAKWPAQGYHRVIWNLLVPANMITADHLDNVVYGSWYPENDQQRAMIRELRYKTTIFTHSNKSLKENEGWKEAFESLYPENLIRTALSEKYKALNKETDGDVINLDHDQLRALYQLEQAKYKTPTYLRTEEDEAVQYRRRHTDWIDDLER